MEAGDAQGLGRVQREAVLGVLEVGHDRHGVVFELLCRISELDHALHLGSVSKEHCYERCALYSKPVESCRVELSEWHKTNEAQFKIDIESSKRKRTGFEAVLVKPFAWMIDDSLNYKAVKESTVTMIENQSKSKTTPIKADDTDLFQQDVQIIAKEGKLYYLP